MTTISVRDRFLIYANAVPGGCWEWSGGRHTKGYGMFSIKNKAVGAHVVSVMLFRGAGRPRRPLSVDHLCRNHSCVNPDHLEVVDIRTNVLRGTGHTAVNARKTYCIHGHPFSPENTYIYGPGWRRCRECARAVDRRSYKKRAGLK